MNRSCLIAVVAACAALGACATRYSPESLSNGATFAEVERTLGQPTGRHAGQPAERIEYARGPFGRHTYMLDFVETGYGPDPLCTGKPSSSQ